MIISGSIGDMSFERILDLPSLLAKKSVFLFGPRATGKTFLIRTQLGNRCMVIDLLRASYYNALLANPSVLEGMIEADSRKWVVIDEIQKIPALLDEVHRLIEEKGYRFLLTGSSARKLKRSGANMLAGRAWRAELLPLSWKEIPRFKLSRALRFGTLPSVWLSETSEDDLDAYVSTYLKEEIQLECRLRNLPAFSRFLKVSALSSGQLVNFARMASDAAVAEATLKDHFEVLHDTLLGFILEPFVETKKRKAISTAKFYLFDNGVRHAILGTEILDRNSDLYGSSFEGFLANELKAYLSYRRIKKGLSFWRSLSGFEVDFVIGHDAAIEVKSATRATDQHLKGLNALSEEKIFRKYFLVSHDPIARMVTLAGGAKAHLLPWDKFLENLWNDEIVS